MRCGDHFVARSRAPFGADRAGTSAGCGARLHRVCILTDRLAQGHRPLLLLETSTTGPVAGWVAYLQVWAAELAPAERVELARRLNLSRKDTEKVRQGPPPPRAVPRSLSISGRTLMAAGVSPGPALGWALTRTLAARREGKISAEEELNYALPSSGAVVNPAPSSSL